MILIIVNNIILLFYDRLFSMLFLIWTIFILVVYAFTNTQQKIC